MTKEEVNQLRKKVNNLLSNKHPDWIMRDFRNASTKYIKSLKPKNAKEAQKLAEKHNVWINYDEFLI